MANDVILAVGKRLSFGAKSSTLIAHKIMLLLLFKFSLSFARKKTKE